LEGKNPASNPQSVRPQFPSTNLPFPPLAKNSSWQIVQFGGRDSQRHPLWLCRCKLCPPPRSQVLHPVRQDFLTSGKSTCCRSCSAVRRASNGHNRRKSVEVTKNTENKNLSLEVKNTDPPESVFAEHFLRSLQTAKVSDLKKRFHYQQPPEIEKVLAESDLSVGAGKTPRNSDGIRGQNLILVGGESGVGRAVRQNLRKRHGSRVRPTGVNPDKYLQDDNPKDSRITLSLRFGTNKKARRCRVRRLLCVEHGEQVVKSHTRQTFILACGCKRKKDIKS
jgi:hypothetical protein